MGVDADHLIREVRLTDRSSVHRPRVGTAIRQPIHRHDAILDPRVASWHGTSRPKEPVHEPGRFVGWGAASGFGPRVTEDAQILSVEFERGGTASTTSRGSWWVEGETESGRTWRIASDEAYEAASSQGYPMDVEVVVSTWTGSTLAVRGDGFDVDRGGGAFRVLWLVTAIVGVVIAVGLAWLLARKESLLAVVSFTVFSPLWVWLGFVFMRAYRT